MRKLIFLLSLLPLWTHAAAYDPDSTALPVRVVGAGISLGDVTLNMSTNVDARIITHITNAVSATLTDGQGSVTALPYTAGDNGSALQGVLPLGFNGTTWDMMRAGKTNIAAVYTGFQNGLGYGIYWPSTPTLTDGQIAPLQFDSTGALKTTGSGGGGGAGTWSTTNAAYIGTNPLWVRPTNTAANPLFVSQEGTNAAYTATAPLWAMVTNNSANPLYVNQGNLTTNLDQVTAFIANASPLAVANAGYSKAVAVTPNILSGSASDSGDYLSNDFAIDCARANGLGVWLTSLQILDIDDISSTKPSFEIYFFSARPTIGTLGAAWAVSDADMANCVFGPVSIPTTHWTALGTVNGACATNNLNILMFPGGSSTTLYGALRATGAFTSSATNVLSFRFKFMQD